MEDVLKLAPMHFFAAMLEGYVGGGKAVPVLSMPGFKETVYEKDGFRVVDRYGSLGDMSSGTTTIWFHGRSIWFMSYWGYYRKEDIPLLKRILKDTYEKGKFIGGRGPASNVAGVGIYTNEVDSGSNFTHFRGVEKISDRLGIRGYHSYWGAGLIVYPTVELVHEL